jgi:hypothetical protein
VDLLLDVNRHDIDSEVFRVLLTFALPNELRIKQGVSRVQQRLRTLFVFGNEAAQLLGWNVGPLVLVRNRFNLS